MNRSQNVFSRLRSARVRLVAALCGLGLFAAIASADEFQWNDWFDPSTTVVLSMTAYEGPQRDGNYERVEVTRGPIIAGAFTVTIRVVTTYEDDLLSATLMVADDNDEDGHIDNEEWTVMGTATLVTVDGVTTATVSPTLVSATKDAYCVEVNTEEDGVHRHVIAGGELTYDEE